jgi:hypothetical protein
MENIYVDKEGKVDINKLTQLFWESFADGQYLIVNITEREKVLEFIHDLRHPKPVEIKEKKPRKPKPISVNEIEVGGQIKNENQ